MFSPGPRESAETLLHVIPQSAGSGARLRAAAMSLGTPHKQRMLRAVSTRPALEDGRMNLLQSICRLFGNRCAPEEAKSAGDTVQAEQSVPADLGQKEAALEKTGKEQMSHMGATRT